MNQYIFEEIGSIQMIMKIVLFCVILNVKYVSLKRSDGFELKLRIQNVPILKRTLGPYIDTMSQKFKYYNYYIHHTNALSIWKLT